MYVVSDIITGKTELETHSMQAAASAAALLSTAEYSDVLEMLYDAQYVGDACITVGGYTVTL